MGKDRDFESRMNGMLYARKILKDNGLETGPLDNEIRMRGITKIEITCPSDAVYDTWRDIVANLYANMCTCMFFTLNESEGWGATRIKRLKERFDENVKTAVDLDYLGEHYTTIEEYAKELNDKYNIGMDLSRLSKTQDNYDKGDVLYHKVRVDRLIEVFRREGMEDAARFLEERVTKDGRFEAN